MCRLSGRTFVTLVRTRSRLLFLFDQIGNDSAFPNARMLECSNARILRDLINNIYTKGPSPTEISSFLD